MTEVKKSISCIASSIVNVEYLWLLVCSYDNKLFEEVSLDPEKFVLLSDIM